MKIGMIGAGKVGFTLGKFFSQGGVQLSGYYSRNPESAKEAAAFTNSVQYCEISDLIRESDAIFITVPDNAIQAVYRQIRIFGLQDKYICHCSGALSTADAFPDIGVCGAQGISIHPLFPVSSKYASYRELPGAFFCLEGDAGAVSVFRELLLSLGVQVQTIASERKVLYHAGCVFASNFICALTQESIGLLTDCGFTPEGARQALEPLMRSNMEHLMAVGPSAALTGPVERCDSGTVSKHLKSLEHPEQRLLYSLLSAKLVELAQEKYPERDYSELNTLLNIEIGGERAR